MNKKATFFSKNIDRVSGALYTGRMNKERLFALVRGLEGAALDCPFEDDFETTVFRHAADRRWFGIYLAVPKRYFGEGEGSEFALNLKCPPELAAVLAESVPGIFPAYHMNKRHWITVRPARVPDEEVEKLLRLSYDLTLRRRVAPRA